MKNKIFTTIFVVALFILILTFAIGLPIYCRFFYYMQIESLRIPEMSGYSVSVIKGAYKAVLDYLTLPWAEFSTGALKYSADGKAHFEDCKRLFNLNASAFIFSTIVLIVIFILSRKEKIGLNKIWGFNPAFLSAVLALGLPLILGGLVAINFDKAFTIFHKIFFPGKDNWMFDYTQDQIINILPQEFFLSCAILIGVCLTVCSVGIIVYCAIQKAKQKNN